MRNRFIILLFLTGLASCSTEKNTLFTRSYHNLTAHYNIYFNGRESFESGVQRAASTFEENYSRILPFFYYTDESVSQSVTPQMKRTLEKGAKVISYHSITAKPDLKRGVQTDKQKDFYNKKEYNKWMDENYVLIGKAYMYQQQYLVAVETFRKVISDYPNEPTKYEAFIWLARAYNELGEYRESLKILNLLENEEELPKEYFQEFWVTYADFFVKQDNYDAAIPMLKRSLDYTKDKSKKKRYTYILAQLYQDNDQNNKALDTYKKVVRMNPPYEMTFNAKINMAASFEGGTRQGREIRSILQKMLKDDKNIEYRDQIYYALGNIALKEGETGEAIDYYEKSAEMSVQNKFQKALTYKALASLYYERPDYSLAQAYYDSTMQNADEEFENLIEIKNKAGNLSKLVRHLVVYEFEDSVQNLAMMPEDERIEAIDKIIENIRKNEEEQRAREAEGQLNMQYAMGASAQSGSGNTGAGSEGKWYFYNLNAKGFGQPEFRMKWGDRELEDNWRRKSKQKLDIDITSEEVPQEDLIDSSAEQTIMSNKTREFYLQNIPLSDSAMSISESRLEVALYNIGLVYRNDLHDLGEAKKSFDELVERFPDGEFTLLGYYELYEIALEENNPQEAERYKNIIIRRYPENPRAKILKNPEYARKLLEEQNRMNVIYEQTYDSYKSGDYHSVISRVNTITEENPDHKLVPKFRLLRALSLGKTDGEDVLKTELESIQADYPDTESGRYAGELVGYLLAAVPELKIADTKEEAKEIYNYTEQGPFFFVISVDEITEANQVNFNMINFNLDNYNQLNLGIQKETINNTILIIVNQFKDLDAANRYLESVEKNADLVFDDVNREKVKVFLISEENMDTLLRDKDALKYKLFYEEYYQKSN